MSPIIVAHHSHAVVAIERVEAIPEVCDGGFPMVNV